MSEDDALGQALLVLARDAIAQTWGQAQRPHPRHPALHEPGATFVTLTQNGQLRGCIGSLHAWRALEQDVCANARAAAFEDPRFTPLGRDELPHTCIEVSLLTPPAPMACADETDALTQLRPHVDGVILEYRGRRGTLLPQVWQTLPEPAAFLRQLKRKAGLPADFWSPEIRLSRYQVRRWTEHPSP